MKNIKFVFISLLLALTFNANASVINVFTDDFESGNLSKWTGKNGGPTTGSIVVDPLDSSNHVLNFNSLGSGGDIFSLDTVATTSTFTLSFDYMGSGSSGGGDGFLGLSLGLPGSHTWLFGNSYPSVTTLIDDGVWRNYLVEISNPYPGQSVHLMMEDFRAVAGNAYFDNILLADTSAIPEPSILALMGFGLAGFGFASRRKLRKP
mgnify:FL=1